MTLLTFNQSITRRHIQRPAGQLNHITTFAVSQNRGTKQMRNKFSSQQNEHHHVMYIFSSLLYERSIQANYTSHLEQLPISWMKVSPCHRQTTEHEKIREKLTISKFLHFDAMQTFNCWKLQTRSPLSSSRSCLESAVSIKAQHQLSLIHVRLPDDKNGM